MDSARTPDALVRDLIDAENTRDRRKADDILAKDFLFITRARGDEQTRASLLDEVAQPKNPAVQRTLVDGSVSTRGSGDLCVVWSVVSTRDTANPGAAEGRFRNVHVFERQQQEWRCLSWQVTKVTNA
jgi:hypothetical protein